MKMLGSTLLATAMLVLAACSGGGDSTESPDPAATADSTATANSTATADSTATELDIEIVDFAFVPATYEVAVGKEVTWMNQDDFAHTVTAGEPNEPTGAFDGRLGDSSSHESSGATFSTTFDEPGTYAYFCDLHPSMTGEIVVTGS